jgi:ABC-2 type transport system permease protein
MRKIARLMALNFNELMSYRLRLVFMVISQFISPLVMILVFTSLNLTSQYPTGQQNLISYYIFTSLIYLFTNSNIDDYLVLLIQEGGLATYLLKPMSFWQVALTRDLSIRIFKLFLGLPLIILAIFLTSTNLTFSLSNLPYLLFTLIISYALTFFFSFSVGLLAIWIEEIWGLQNLKNVSIIILSGVVLPSQIFPATLQNILIYTPFPYLINWSIRLGFTGSITKEFLIASIWTLIFYLIARFTWTKCIKKYSAFGVS